MSQPRRRFWTAAAAQPVPSGWTVALDGRPIRTPAGAPLHLPTAALARAIAAEWDAQPETLDPQALPLTRAANTALDRVAPRRPEVAAEIAAYAAADLLAHRAPGPAALIARQAALWDPPLHWAARSLNARLILTEGVMPVDQPPAALAALAAAVDAFEPFALTALHELTALSGSVVLGLAVAHRALAPETAWEAAILDEAFQAAQWGEDPEAACRRALRRAAFLEARAFLDLLDAKDPA